MPLLSAAACSESVTESRIVERRPPPTMMVTCQREPFPPPKDGSDEAKGAWFAGVIVAGEDCRRKADDLQGWHAKGK
jgi:hypothetical protein